MEKLKEWKEQLLLVFQNKTIDAIFPPLIFFLANQFFSLEMSAGLTLIYLVALIIYRVFKKHTKKYVLVGVGGSLVSIGFSFWSGEAINYYLPGLISTGMIVIACVASLLMKKPLAALLSHITRGWPIEWYFRDDIRPAYEIVTLLWAVYFFIRLAVQTPLFLMEAFSAYFFVNNILGWPLNITILIITYVIGIQQLRKRKGPSVEEFINNEQPPFEGQQKGF
ncbi:Protein of unknown function [Pelagirhabdus alkalitolerans]|uniref:Intracellular septation protein A n=1 Tax=Pelagirhabdus alkalitolerans TaxID=1612202 RepID=A0A1G6M3E8_9BACI|nr:DUF3159 domain-containing protein [Pelagirhabdus alkalitolerans]SDC49824.1 Protein of unknown function [Pelagirhabdus alkalitolerans]